MALYSSVQDKGGKYVVKLASREIELVDDKPYLDYFANGKPVFEFMANESVWGEDLTKYAGFADEVLSNVEKIKQGVCLI